MDWTETIQEKLHVIPNGFPEDRTDECNAATKQFSKTTIRKRARTRKAALSTSCTTNVISSLIYVPTSAGLWNVGHWIFLSLIYLLTSAVVSILDDTKVIRIT